jgi:uncharacterized membrane protein
MFVKKERLQAALFAVVLVNAIFVGLITDVTLFVENVKADQGGPDAYGYLWTDNVLPSPLISYNWVEISTLPGTDSGVSYSDDGDSFSLGFTFDYYGNSYTDVNIYSHGYINFGPLGGADWTNNPIPDTNTPNDMIAAYWDDLIGFGSTGGIYNATLGSAPNRMFVVQWNTSDGIDTINFEIILHETTNNITMQYNWMDWDGSGATVGIENIDGTDGLEYSYNNPLITNGLAIRYFFTPPDWSLDLGPMFERDYGYATWNVDYILTIVNKGINDDTYDLSSSFNLWPVVFRDIGDTMDITSIFVTSGFSEDFIVRVSITGGASAGDLDWVNTTATSQGDPSVNASAYRQTQVPHNVNWQEGFEGAWNWEWVPETFNPGNPIPTNWEIGDPMGWGPGSAYNGTNCSGTNINDDYYMDADIAFISPYVEMGPGAQMLGFYHWYEMDTFGDEGGFVEISVAGGPWNQIFPQGGYPYIGGFIGGYWVDAYSGLTSGWEYEEFDLSAYAGQVVQVRFHFASDGWGWQTGWYIDDVYMGSPPPYRVNLGPGFQSTYGGLGTNVDYILTVDNSGANDDTYDLTSLLNLWPVTFRDIGDTMDITSIFVTSGLSDDFIVRVSVPGGATPGDIDFADITATSQGDPSKSDTASIRTQTPYIADWFDSFDSGWGGWTTQVFDEGNPVPTYWELGDPSGWGPSTAYNGTDCAATNIVDDYYMDADISLVTPYVELGSGAQVLGFYNWFEMDTMGAEGGFVEISVAGGPWNQIDPVGGYPYIGGFIGGYWVDAYSGITTGWEYEEFDLSAYASQVVQVRFHFASDGWGWQAGWYVDEVYMGAPPPYVFKLEPFFQSTYGNLGTNVDYILTVNNTGSLDDTYDLSSALNLWPVTFRDIGDTMDITSIFVTAGTTEDFIVRVSVPGGATPGDLDFVNVTAVSQGDPSKTDTASIRTQAPFNADWLDSFEGGWNAWTTQVFDEGNPTPTYWEIGDPSGWGPSTAYDGTDCAGTNLVDDYYMNADINLDTPYVQLGSGTQLLWFLNWYEMDTGGDEGGFVEISVDDGPWNQIDPVGGYPYLGGWIGGYNVDAYSGDNLFWNYEEFDLSAYSNQVVRVRFHFASDWWGWQAGWYIDYVYMGAPPPYELTLYPDFQPNYGFAGTNVDFMLSIDNTGTSDDTYDLSTSGSIWPVTFRDIWDTMDITTLFVSSGNTEDFIARVSVPGGALPGDLDSADITATSQGDPGVSETAQIDTQVPYAVNWLDGFESGWGNWMAEVIAEDQWNPTYWEIEDPSGWGPGSANNGLYCAGTNIWDWYYENNDITLISPYVEVGSGMQVLSFYQWYEMDTWGDDGGFVEVSVANGPWSQIWPMNGYPFSGGFIGGYNTDGYSGSAMVWSFDEFDMSAYNNQVVQVRFHFSSSPWWGWQDGWYIDDIYIGDPVPYRCSLTPDYTVSLGDPSSTVDYIMTLRNTGANTDTYDLSSSSIWPVTFRDIGDTMDITTIVLGSGASQDFIARITIPPVPFGAFDLATLTATSQNDPMVDDDAQVETNVPVTPPVFDDMESGIGPWRDWDDGDGTQWQLGDPSPWAFGPVGSYSPLNSWGTNIVGNYSTDGEATLTSPYLDLTIATDANLTFWHWYDINGGWNDAAWVEVSDDFGNSWTRIFPTGGYPDWDWNGENCYAGTSAGWEWAEFDLNAYLGETILVQFHFWDAPWDGPTEGPGWYIDDVNVSATYLSYGVDLTPDQDFEIEADGFSVLYLMTATNLGSAGPDTFDLSDMSLLGWPVSILDLSMSPITAIGPIPPGNSEDFYLQVNIPGGTLPMTQETTGITAISQNDPSMTPAEDTSIVYTEVLATILLVDDDDGFDAENEFEAALTDGGWEYNTWSYVQFGPPDLAELQDHSAVLWFTGNDYDDTISPTLSSSDRTLVGNYLDWGGRFYLSSSCAGPDSVDDWGGSDTWTPWYETYLHSNYIMAGGWMAPHTVNGTPGDSIGDGLNLDAYAGDYNPFLWGVWTINEPINQGSTIFTEISGPSNIATKADTGTYRVVYTGFDLASINGAVNRSTLMDRIIQWLLFGDKPKVDNTTPVDGGLGVPINQDIIIVFTEPMIPGSVTYTIEPNPGGIADAWSAGDTILTISHTDFAPATRYWVNITAGTDLDTNNLDPLPYSFYFDTTSGLTSATVTGQTGGPTNVAGITITYITANGPATVDLYYTTDTMSPYTWTFFGTDNPADGSYGWTVPSDGYYGWFAVSPDESAPLSTDSPESSFYIYDATQPQIQTTVPADMDVGVATNQDIIITFNEVMNPGSVSGTVEPDPGGITPAWSGGDTILTLTHNDFAPGTRYWVNVTSGTDLAGNNLNPLPDGFYFDTAVGTTATATGPIGGPTNVAGITITYGTSGSPPTADLYYTTDTLSPYTWNLIGTDNPADGSYGWTVPADGYYGWFAKSPDESAPTGTDAPEVSSYIYDATQPNVQTTTPADMDVGVSVTQDVIITFNEIMIPGSVTYTVEPNPGGLGDGWSGGDTIITISHSNFAPGTRYWVNVTAGTDLATNNINPLPYSFYFDTSAPTTATATGPLGGPTNVAGITIAYGTTNSPATTGLYYTTDTLSPYTWNFIGTDNPADGSYGWTVPSDGSYGWYAKSPDESAPLSTDAPEASIYLFDGTQPVVQTSIPAHMDIDVAVDQDVEITFDETMIPGSVSYTMEPNPGGLSNVWSGVDTLLTISHNDFGTSMRFWVNITAGTDLAGNDLNPLPHSFYFDTTSIATTATATGPVSPPTNIAGITLTYTTTGGPPTADLYYTTDTGSPYTWNLIGTDNPADGSYGWTVPADGYYGWQALSPDEPALLSTDAPEASFYIYDATQPGVFSTNPVDLDTGVPINQDITITFDETMNPLAVTYTIEPSPGGLSELWSGVDSIVTISHNNFATGSTYWVNVTAGTDLAGNNLNTLPYSFSFDTAATAAIATGPVSGPTNVAAVTLSYNTMGAPPSVDLYYTTDTSTPYTWNLIGTDNPADGSYGWTVPADGSYGWLVKSPDENAPTTVDSPESAVYIYDATQPTVSSTDPLDTAPDVLLNQLIIITFDEPMNTGSLTYTIEPNPGGLSEFWSVGDTVVTISHIDFAAGTRHWVNITAASDLAGNTLNPLPYSFYFDTEIPDLIPPTVISGAPVGLSVNILSNIMITFSEAMNTASVESAFSFTDGTTTWTVADGTANWNPAQDTMTFNPTANFDNSRTITVTIDGSIAMDASGNTLDGNGNGTSEGTPDDDYVWAFTTEAVVIPDTKPPISSVSSLSSHQNSLTFDVIYVASDSDSGVSEVELWYNKDNGGWVLYNTYTGGSKTISFTASSDGDYSFYSRARDNENNYEVAPSFADATTIVDATIPTISSIVLSDPSPVTEGSLTFTITFSEDMDTGVTPMVSFGLTSPYQTHTVIESTHTLTTWVGTFAINTATGDGTNTLRIALAQDIAGNQIVIYTMQFEIDTIHPTVSTAGPQETDVVVTTSITITFDEGMDTTSVEDAFSYTDGTTTWTASDGSISWSGNTMTFTPSSHLDPDTDYTASVGTDAMDIAGNHISTAHTWSFTTIPELDTTPPSVTTVSHTGDDAKISKTLTITFSEPMNHTEVEEAITISPGVEIEGFSWSGNTLTINLKDELEPNTEYTVTVGTAAKDQAGNSLDEPYTFTFTPKEVKEESGFGATLLLLILIVVIVVVLLLFLMMKKKKSQEVPPETTQIQPAEDMSYPPPPPQEDVTGGQEIHQSNMPENVHQMPDAPPPPPPDEADMPDETKIE